MQIWETSWVKKWAWKNNYEENPDPKREHEKEEYVENPEQKIEYEEKKKKKSNMRKILNLKINIKKTTDKNHQPKIRKDPYFICRGYH